MQHTTTMTKHVSSLLCTVLWLALASAVFSVQSVAQSSTVEVQERPGATNFASPYPTKGTPALTRLREVQHQARMESAKPKPTHLYENDQYRLTKRWISGQAVGETYVFEIVIEAKQAIYNVRVLDVIDAGMEHVRSTPAAKDMGGSALSWFFETLAAGESKTIQVQYRATAEGQFQNHLAVSVDNAISIGYRVGLPRLRVTKQGPAVVEMGENATWRVTVVNEGTAPARDVVVEDTFPEGFSGTQSRQNIGVLEPGQTRVVEFVAKATKEGDYRNVASAQFSGGQVPVRGEAPVRVVRSRFDLKLVGTPQSYVFASGKYVVTLTNTGSTTLQNMVVTHVLPDGAEVASPGGASVADRTMTWSVPQLAPGASETLTFTLRGVRPGLTSHTVTALAGGLREQGTVATTWLAVPGLTTKLSDSRDPIQVGEKTVYTISIGNQGQFKPIGTKIVLRLSPELKPVRVIGTEQGQIKGQVVEFPGAQIEAGKDIVIRVEVEGVKAGYGEAVLEVTPDFMERTIINQESTTVF